MGEDELVTIAKFIIDNFDKGPYNGAGSYFSENWSLFKGMVKDSNQHVFTDKKRNVELSFAITILKEKKSLHLLNFHIKSINGKANYSLNEIVSIMKIVCYKLGLNIIIVDFEIKRWFTNDYDAIMRLLKAMKYKQISEGEEFPFIYRREYLLD